MIESRPPQQQGPAPAIRPIGPAASPQPPRIPGVPVQPVKTHDPNTEPMPLVEEPQKGAQSGSKIRAITGAGMGIAAREWKRQPTMTGQGAIRVRSFHGRLSEEGLAYMDEKINEWLDSHPEIEVKFATTTIGQFEGKIRELALVVNIWY